MGDRRRGVRLAVLMICGLSFACHQDDVQRCEALLDGGDHSQAVTQCTQVFETTSQARAGLAVAHAQHELGADDKALVWVERLAGTDVEPAVLNLAAKIHHRRGERDTAKSFYERVLDIPQERRDSNQAARSLYGLSYIAWEESDYTRALAYARHAAEAAIEAGNLEIQVNAGQVMVTLLYDLGDLDGATQALQSVREASGAESQARLLSHTGALRLDQGRPALARSALEEALGASSGDEEKRFFRSVHLNLVQVALELDELDAAADQLDKATAYAESGAGNQTALLYFQAQVERRQGRTAEAVATLEKALGQETIEGWSWKLDYELGLTEEAHGNVDDARAAYERAAATVENLRGTLTSDELKSWLLDQKRQPLEALFRLAAIDGQGRDALAVIERAKARTFLDAFIRSATPPPSAAPEAVADRVRVLQDLLPTLGTSPVVTPAPIQDLLDAVSDRHLLVYFETNDQLWLAVVAAGPIVPRQLAETEEIQRLVREFLAQPHDERTAIELSQLLLPEGVLPSTGEPLYVVPDGVLGRLPFAALRHRDRFLIEKHPVVYIPSLTALVAIESRPRGSTTPPVVLGDPQQDLTAAAREAREVAEQLSVIAQIGHEADIEALAEASTSDVLHLAIHSGVDAKGPWLGLADGEVRAMDLLTAGSAPRLVMLASCNSATRRGRGLWGSAAAAYLAAGSDTVVAALWSIDDEATYRMVSSFYEQDGISDPVEALAGAQRAAIQAGEPVSNWAAFTVLGTGRHLERE